jgi:hypothetical protein
MERIKKEMEHFRGILMKHYKEKIKYLTGELKKL